MFRMMHDKFWPQRGLTETRQCNHQFPDSASIHNCTNAMVCANDQEMFFHTTAQLSWIMLSRNLPPYNSTTKLDSAD